jgi:hypothetical protein
VPQYLFSSALRIQGLCNDLYAHLADELATEGVDDTGYGGGLALADEVEIEHTLHSSRLQTAVKRIRLTKFCEHFRRKETILSR